MTRMEVSYIQASTTWGSPEATNVLCIAEGSSASPVIWNWEGEAKEEFFNSAGRGLRTREERECWRRGREKNKPLRGGVF